MKYVGLFRSITIIIILLYSFWNLHSGPLNPFDEARYGVNAMEMMKNGDYLNLYYAGKPDDWVFRPPLWIWCIILSYKVFGYNLFALRFPAAICILGFFYFTYRWVRLYKDEYFALFVVALLAINKGITGFHVSRTGDMDAALLLGLSIFLFYFSLFYTRSLKLKYALLAAVGLLIAFYTKTTASVLYLPGVILFLAWERKLKTILLNRNTWIGLSVYITGILVWIVAIELYGNKGIQNTFYGQQPGNAWKQMIVYDTWKRMTSSEFDGHPVKKNYAFYIECIDSVFNPWNYGFYAGLLLVMVLYFNRQKKGQPYTLNGLLKMSICILIPIVIVLTFGMHKLHWYTAPTLAFLAVWVAEFLWHFHKVHKLAWILTAALFVVFGIKHFLKDIAPFEPHVLEYPAQKNYDWIMIPYPNSNFLLYALWNKRRWEVFSSKDTIPIRPNTYYLTSHFMDTTKFKLIHRYRKYPYYKYDIYVAR
ncbi:MAG: glycosyltransferase family 39 protein [Bacteroidia bacterium]|nr:glycosyltransferase family 39 protein [Bacteroidia bacterium]MDW8347653.1 glycosyltransferase family 39 protein [Bacteroidia bacterium]